MCLRTQIQEHRESVSLKIQTGVIPSPMKGQAAASGTKPPVKKAKQPEVKTLELAEDAKEPAAPKKKKPVLGSQKKVSFFRSQAYFPF